MQQMQIALVVLEVTTLLHFLFKIIQMNSHSITFLLLLLLGTSCTYAQSDQEQIQKLETEQQTLEERQLKIHDELEQLRLAVIRQDLEALGTPTSTIEQTELVKHAGMFLLYDEQHEQARWVTHIILPQVNAGNLSRTNDFRIDPKVSTGTADKPDYWYSGFDRGHIAPSADFKWSKTAISESYFYSNMAPQRPELNREKWAELEGWGRSQVFNNKEQLVVVSGPILTDDLPKITQGENKKLSIPKQFYKIFLDNEGDEKKAIAFLMDNSSCNKPLVTYAVTVDEIEKLTGIDFFPNLDKALQDKLESSIDWALWDRASDKGMPDAVPLSMKQRPKNTINTLETDLFIDKNITVCGTVVSTKKTKSGAVFLNLDTKFPNQIYSVTIWASAIQNFSYSPEIELLGKKVCIRGKLTKKDGDAPSTNVTNEKKIEIIDEEDF